MVSALTVDGRSVLARTPWSVTPSIRPAQDEPTWVRHWRGGWQLCFPNTGPPRAGARPTQGFHGVASQLPWRVLSQGAHSMTLAWEDEYGLLAERTLALLSDGLKVSTTATNAGAQEREISVAEHLVLGDDLLAAVRAGGPPLRFEAPQGTMFRPLDYDGTPSREPEAWPGDEKDRWQSLDAATPARLAALLKLPGRRVSLSGSDFVATVTWGGLPHMLLWEELAQSREQPWDGKVVALGLEPTSTPHGAGLGGDNGGAVGLSPGGTLTWTTELRVRTTTEDDGT